MRSLNESISHGLQEKTMNGASEKREEEPARPHGQFMTVGELQGAVHRRHPLTRLNAISPYYTMFPLDFPYSCLDEAKNGDWVLDPFCGRGTTNFAARLKGLPSVGLDASPVAAAIAAAKLVNTTPAEVTDLCSDLISRPPMSVPEGEFWEWCYHPQTLINLCSLREALLQDCTTDAAIALRALILGILHGPVNKNTKSYLSNQMPRTYSPKPDYSVRFWKTRGLHPKKINLLELVARKANYFFSSPPPPSPGNILWADSREESIPAPEDGFRWIVTSPPYLGMNTYIPDQWLRHWFLGGASSVEYSRKYQIGRTGVAGFTDDLANVWRNVADCSAPGASMIIRFGSLPSHPHDPRTVLTASFERADCGWEVVKCESAGVPKRAKRQSEHFTERAGAAREEIDLYAILTYV